MDEARLRILDMIQNGVVSALEGEMLLDALDGSRESADQSEMAQPAESMHAAETAEESISDAPIVPPSASPPAWARQIWIYLLAGGVLLLALAGIVTGQLVQGGSRLGWLACTVPLMVFGALIVALAWWSRVARWIHVRIRNKGTRLNLSLPLPLRLIASLIRLARPWVPQLRDIAVDELILSMAEMETEDIMMVEVNEEDGEEVQVYFG